MKEFNYIELNDKSFEELTQIRDEVMKEINENEMKRQQLIENIMFLQKFKDLFSLKNGIFRVKVKGDNKN